MKTTDARPRSLEEENLEFDFSGATGDPEPTFPLDRREFLKLAGGGILVFCTVPLSGAMQEGERRRGGGQQLPQDFDAFLRIGEDGRVTGFTGKIEMGQGVITSLAQMLADELDVALSGRPQPKPRRCWWSWRPRNWRSRRTG
ncbi:MAG: molybdopterin-dependent oxidoreductase [Acidobacteriia bacterium]|nr:molybdopterin-dependent oxidoreductase [Terriglobia bacterium]